jgi:hypothetical protein
MPASSRKSSKGINSSVSKPSVKQNSTNLFMLILVLIVVGVGGFMIMKDNDSMNPFKAFVQKTPYEVLTQAIEKTKSISSLYIDYKSTVSSHISSTQSVITETNSANIDGSAYGTMDGKTYSLEMKVYNKENPNRSIDLSILSVEDGDLYIKTAQSAPKWQHITKEEADKSNEPTDASYYVLDFLGTVLSPHQALLASLDKETIEKVEDVKNSDTTREKIKGRVKVTEYVSLLKKDDLMKDAEIDDAATILKDAEIYVTVTVDKKSGYIIELTIDGKKLTQIETSQSKELGVSVTHDLKVEATLSRFGTAPEVTSPRSRDVLGTSTGPSLPSIFFK